MVERHQTLRRKAQDIYDQILINPTGVNHGCKPLAPSMQKNICNRNALPFAIGIWKLNAWDVFLKAKDADNSAHLR